MFGDMLGNLEEQKAKMADRLSQIKLTTEAGGGAIKLDCNASGVVENIHISNELLENSDAQQLEDLLITAVNRAFLLIKETESKEANSMLKDMLPPGMDHLLG